jgi:hypothetical protein
VEKGTGLDGEIGGLEGSASIKELECELIGKLILISLRSV